MFKNKVLIFSIVFLLLFTFNISATTENEKNISEIRNFIYDVYYNYQYKNFETVYDYMHFEIKELLDKEKYLNFQIDNTEKIDLKISEVKVINVKIIDKWPEEFENIITNKENHKLYEIEIEYMTNYNNNGQEQEKLINKKTYVVRYENNNYLLWDPDIINN